MSLVVDVLSGGRLRLGVGLGWIAVEYEALGVDFHTRGRRMEEQIELRRELLHFREKASSSSSLVTSQG